MLSSLLRRLFVAAAVGMFLAPASGKPVMAQNDKISIIFVGCGPADGFHGYVNRGAAMAARELGVSVTYIPLKKEELTIATQLQKIEEAIAAKPHGLAICAYAEDAAYQGVVARAREAGIVVGSSAAPAANSQVRDPQDLFLFRVGSDESAAGRLTAQRLIEMGVTGRVLVAQQRHVDVTCRARGESEVEALREAGIEADYVELSPDADQQTEATLDYLRRHPDTQAVTSVCDEMDGFLTAKEESGRDDLILTGYDILSPETLEAIRDGRQAFAIDQQQFWRGYMPVLLLTHFIRFGLVKTNHFLTGPQIVDASNVDRVAELVKQGIR